MVPQEPLKVNSPPPPPPPEAIQFKPEPVELKTDPAVPTELLESYIPPVILIFPET
jgi:hypothetical protein